MSGAVGLVVRLDEVRHEVLGRLVRPIGGQPQAQPEGRAALLREVELVVPHAARTVSMKCRWLLLWGVARQCGAMLLRGSAARGVRGVVRWFPCPPPHKCGFCRQFLGCGLPAASLAGLVSFAEKPRMARKCEVSRRPPRGARARANIQRASGVAEAAPIQPHSEAALCWSQ